MHAAGLGLLATGRSAPRWAGRGRGAAAGPTTPSPPISRPQDPSSSHGSWSFVMRASGRTTVQSFILVRCLSVTTVLAGSADLLALLAAAGYTLNYWDLDIRNGEPQMDQRAKFHLLRMDIRHHDRGPCMYPLAVFQRSINTPQRARGACDRRTKVKGASAAWSAPRLGGPVSGWSCWFEERERGRDVSFLVAGGMRVGRVGTRVG